MIPLAGLGSNVALGLVDATRARQITSIETSRQHGRAIETFRETVGDVRSVDDLLENREVYTFVMRAFDLEDQIFGKAMIGKILEGDLDDSKALINRLTDSRFRAFYKEMGFTEGGTANANTLDPAWVERMVDRYVEQKFINDTSEQNATVGTALEFRRAAPKVETWFDILKNRELGTFMRRALGISDEVVKVGIDRQVDLFARKFDIGKLKDPAEVEKLVRKYVAISDALDPTRAGQSAAVQLMNGAVAIGQGGDYRPSLFDISSVNISALSIYR